LHGSVQTKRGVVEEVVALVVEEVVMATLCATAATGRAILLVSVLREMEAILVEVEEEFATDVTGRATLQGSALRVREAVLEEEEEQFAIAVTGQDILPGNVLRLKEVGGVAGVEATCATAVTGLATLQGSALREMERAADLAEAVTLAAVAALGQEGTEMEVAGMEGMVDQNATSATGLVTLPANAGRRRTAATNVMALAILQGTAGRRKKLATIATGWVMW